MDSNNIVKSYTPLSGCYGFVRHDVLKWVPSEARRVPSVRCPAGQTERVLVERGCHVVGIEKSAEVAEKARKHDIEVICGDVEELVSDCKVPNFDCIIYADVLGQHLDFSVICAPDSCYSSEEAHSGWYEGAR